METAGVGRRGALLFVLAWAIAGCSFFAERPPPSDPSERTAHVARELCPNDKYMYPLADAVSVAAGVTWVLYANRAWDGDPLTTYTDDQGQTQTIWRTAPDHSNTVKLERDFGYASIGVFGAAALWGWYAELECKSLRDELAHGGVKPKSPSAVRRGFPSRVLGYHFEMTPGQAEAACQAQHQIWHSEGGKGQCASASGSTSPEVDLEFELGTPSSITVIYWRTPSELGTAQHELLASLASYYGPPDSGGTLSTSCSGSLARCLEAGEEVPPARWHWPRGDIELRPVLDDGEARIEIRYARVISEQ